MRISRCGLPPTRRWAYDRNTIINCNNIHIILFINRINYHYVCLNYCISSNYQQTKITNKKHICLDWAMCFLTYNQANHLCGFSISYIYYNLGMGEKSINMKKIHTKVIKSQTQMTIYVTLLIVVFLTQRLVCLLFTIRNLQ